MKHLSLEAVMIDLYFNDAKRGVVSEAAIKTIPMLFF